MSQGNMGMGSQGMGSQGMSFQGMGSSRGMPPSTSMGAGPMGGMSGAAGPSPVIYSGPPASSGYGGRGGMPDGRGGMADGRGGMTDVRGGMPDVRGGMPDVRGGMPDGRGGMSGGPPMQDTSKGLLDFFY